MSANEMPRLSTIPQGSSSEPGLTITASKSETLIPRTRPYYCSERQTITVYTSCSIFVSLLFVKVKEFVSSCFTCIKTGNKGNFPAAVPKSAKAASSPSICTKASCLRDMKSEKKEKPLRERVSEPSAPPPILPAAKTMVGNFNGEKKEASVNQKFVWADRYRPKSLKDFICNRSEATRLLALEEKYRGCGHVIFEGPPGVGKKTMIWAMLRDAFGPDRVQAREEGKAFDLKGESRGRIEVNVKESSKHVEINLLDLQGYEKHVIAELMKETQTKTSKSNKALSSYSENCRVIVLCEADSVSTDVLVYVKWLLERYKGDYRVFFCCCDVSKLEPIRSLCTLFQLRPPSKEEIVEVLEFIAKQEGIYLPHKLAEMVANNSKNNLRQAIRSFEACCHSSYPFKEDQVILTGWEEHIADIAKNMVEERSPKQLYIIRGKLQILMEHDVPPDFIFMSLVGELKKHLHQNLHPEVDSLYDEYNGSHEGMIERENQMRSKVVDPVKNNMRIFFRIEEFVARFMSCYNNQSRMANAGNTKAPWSDHYSQAPIFYLRKKVVD